MGRIDAKYLTKVYKNGVYALKNCSLSVKAGEFLVIVGASGSGKSTLLKVIAGTEPLSCGELYIDGILSENISVEKRGVSMVFQECVLYPHMTVFDNLAMPLKLIGEDEKNIYDKVINALRIFGLEIAADVKPRHLSGGEQQRVALAKALLKQSKVVLLDEPLSNVDEKSRWEYCKTLKAIKKMLPQSTFVYVTHNTKEAFMLADRIAVMQDGEIVQIGTKGFMAEHFDFENLSQSLSASFSQLKLKGRLDKDVLSFENKTVELNNEYISRLLFFFENVDVVMPMENFSKIPISDCFSLVFLVEKNHGEYVTLKIYDKQIILNEKTNLKEGEKIRLYYPIRELMLYRNDKRVTCHYPIQKKIPLKVINADKGTFTILGKKINASKSIPENTKYALITQSAFVLSNNKGKCAVRVHECLDEEFINGKKLVHVAIKGNEGYLSFVADESVSPFEKKKLWLNIIPSEIAFDVV